MALLDLDLTGLEDLLQQFGQQPQQTAQVQPTPVNRTDPQPIQTTDPTRTSPTQPQPTTQTDPTRTSPTQPRTTQQAPDTTTQPVFQEIQTFNPITGLQPGALSALQGTGVDPNQVTGLINDLLRRAALNPTGPKANFFSGTPFALGGANPTNVGLPFLQQLAGSNILGSPGQRLLAQALGQPQQQQVQGGPFEPQSFLQSVQQFAPSADGFRQWWQTVGQQMFPGVRFIDHPIDPKLQLPDGRFIDAIIGAGGPNPQWGVQFEGGGAGGGTSVSGGGGGVAPPTGGFGGFGGGGGGAFGVPGFPVGDEAEGGPFFQDPFTRQLETLISQRLEELGQPVNDPARQQLAQVLQGRLDALAAPPFTEGQESALRTGTIDEIEVQRQQAIRNTMERLGQRGFAPSSGLVEDEIRKINAQFDALRAQESGQFGQFAVTENQRRADQRLSVANALAQVAAQTRGEETDRRSQALALAGLLTELPERRLQLALQTLGGAGPSGSLFQGLQGLAGLQQGQQGLLLQQQAINDSRNQGFFGGLGGILGSLFSGGSQSAPGSFLSEFNAVR